MKELNQFLKSSLLWLRSTYSESDGNGSSTRFHIGLLTLFVLSAGVSFAHLVHIHVITIEQFNSFLTSSAMFLTATAGPLYGINKLADWATNRNQPSSTPNPAPPTPDTPPTPPTGG